MESCYEVKLPEIQEKPVVRIVPKVASFQKLAQRVRGKSNLEKHQGKKGLLTSRGEETKQIIFSKVDTAYAGQLKASSKHPSTEHLQIKSKFASIFKNVLSPESGDMLRVMSKVKDHLKKQNLTERSCLPCQDSFSKSDLINETPIPLADPKSDDEDLDKFFLTQQQQQQQQPQQQRNAVGQKKNCSSLLYQTQEFAKLPAEASYCLYCPHCIQAKGDQEKLKKLIRKSLQFDESLFLEKEQAFGKLTSNLLQSYYGSQIMSRRDQILLENLIFYLVEEKLDPEEVLSDDLYQQIKESWLYQGFMWADETRERFEELQRDELGTDWIEGKYQKWINFEHEHFKMNDCYSRYYSKYFGQLKKEPSKTHASPSSLPPLLTDLSLLSNSGTTLDEFYLRKFNLNVEEIKAKCGDVTNQSQMQKRVALSYMYLKVVHRCRSIQEVIKQTAGKNKEKGLILLRLVKRFLEQNERLWLHKLEKIKQLIDKLANDRDFLLNKASQHLKQKELKQVLDNECVTYENLAEHKRVINQIIGQLYCQQDEQYLNSVKLKFAEKDMREWFFEWDKIKIYDNLREKVAKVEPEPFVQRHIQRYHDREISRPELLLLANAERIIHALNVKTKWDFELESAKQAIMKGKEELLQMEDYSKKVFDEFQDAQVALILKEQVVLQLNYQIEQLKKSMELRPKKHNWAQTEVSMKQKQLVKEIDGLVEKEMSKEKGGRL